MRGSIWVRVEPSSGTPVTFTSSWETSYVFREFFEMEYVRLTSTSLLRESPKNGISNPFLE